MLRTVKSAQLIPDNSAKTWPFWGGEFKSPFNWLILVVSATTKEEIKLGHGGCITLVQEVKCCYPVYSIGFIFSLWYFRINPEKPSYFRIHYDIFLAFIFIIGSWIYQKALSFQALICSLSSHQPPTYKKPHKTRKRVFVGPWVYLVGVGSNVGLARHHPHWLRHRPTITTWKVWMLVAFKILSSYYPVLYSQRHLGNEKRAPGWLGYIQ